MYPISEQTGQHVMMANILCQQASDRKGKDRGKVAASTPHWFKYALQSRQMHSVFSFSFLSPARIYEAKKQTAKSQKKPMDLIFRGRRLPSVQPKESSSRPSEGLFLLFLSKQH